MSNIDCWPVTCCCLIGLDGREWLSMSMTHTQPQQPGTSSSSSSNWSPVQSHAAAAAASHSEPTPSRTRAWTARPELIPVVLSGLEVSSQHRRLGHSVLSTPNILDLVHLLGGSQSLVPDCGLLGMASARRPRSSLCRQPRRVALIGLALPSRTQLARLIPQMHISHKCGAVKQNEHFYCKGSWIWIFFFLE